MDAMFQQEVTVSTQTTQPIRFQMDAFARLVSLDICATNPCAPQHALKDMANASLESQPPSQTQFANVNLVGKAKLVAHAHLTLNAQRVHLPMPPAFFPTNASAMMQPTLSATFTKKGTNCPPLQVELNFSQKCV